MKEIRQRIGFAIAPERITSRVWAAAFLAIALATAAGCGQSAPPRVPVFPVEGRVEVNGRPADGALVVLHPKTDTSLPAARAQVKSDGTFTAMTYQPADGAAEGDYIVTVEWYKPVQKRGEWEQGPNLVAAKFGRPQTSQIEVHVAAQANQLPPIKVTR
jgi:hypothetical protein